MPKSPLIITKNKKIRPQDKKLVQLVAKTGNATASYQQLYPTANKNTANSNASKILSKPEVKEYFLKILDDVGLDEKQTAKDLKELIKAGIKNKSRTSPSDSLRGLEIAYRLRGKLGNEKQGSISSQDEFLDGAMTDISSNPNTKQTLNGVPTSFVPIHTQNIYILNQKSNNDLLELLKIKQKQTEDLINIINHDKKQTPNTAPPPPQQQDTEKSVKPNQNPQ